MRHLHYKPIGHELTNWEWCGTRMSLDSDNTPTLERVTCRRCRKKAASTAKRCPVCRQKLTEHHGHVCEGPTVQQKVDRIDKGTLALNILTAREMARVSCNCWEGCNDREGKLPCVHDILYEGVKLWVRKFGTVKKARYR